MKKMMKKMIMATMMVAMVLGMSTVSYAAEGWQKNDTGWWYATNDAETEWYADGWYWIDSNGDGIAECYCFDGDGYMYADCVTPDGYTVDANGAWTVDGKVRIQEVSKPESNSSELATGYNEYGVSNVAIDMLTHTREENAKYGETISRDVAKGSYDHVTDVCYSNGFEVCYSDDYAAEYNDIPTYYVSIGGIVGTCADVFEGADPTIEYATEARDYLKSLGLSNATCPSRNGSKDQEATASFTLDGRTIYVSWHANPDNSRSAVYKAY